MSQIAQDERPGVVHVIARMNVGGPASNVMRLCEGLSARWRTSLITGTVDTGEVDVLPEAQARGIRISRIPELGRRIAPLFDVTALRKLVALLRAERPSVVWTHTAKAGALGRVAARLAGVPHVVHSYHGHVFHGYFPARVSSVVVSSERMLGRITDRIVTLNQSQRLDIVDRYRVARADKVRVIPLGMELAPFLTPTAGAGKAFRSEFAPSGEKIVSIIGRLAPIKRHDLFIEAAVRVLQTGMKPRFVIVGGGSEESNLRQLVKKQDLDRDILFAGWRRDMVEVCAGSDLIVLCSDNEGTPASLIEAMAAGVPVAATRVGGVPELLGGGEFGDLIPANDPRALAMSIVTVLRDEYSREHALARKNKATSQFTVERMLRDADTLLNELVFPTRNTASGGRTGRC